MDLPAAPVAGALDATLGALLADARLSRFEQERARAAAPWAAAIMAALVWGGQLGGFAIQEGIGWPPSLWTGILVLTAGTAAAVTAVARPALRTSTSGSWSTENDVTPTKPARCRQFAVSCVVSYKSTP